MRHLAWLAMLAAPVAIAQQALGLGDMRLAALEDPVRIVYRAGTQPPSPERLRQTVSIIAASRGWTVASEKDERWALGRVVRGKHAARVDLACDSHGCVISYVDSEDLLYEERAVAGSRLRVIHRNYNNWIRDLAASLSGGLGVPAEVVYGFAPVATVDAVPFLNDAGRRGYAEFLAAGKPRAFAIAPNGAWGAGNQGAGGAPTSFFNANSQDPLRTALARCNQTGEGKCRLYAVDDRVLWSAADSAQAAPRSAPVVCATDPSTAKPGVAPAARGAPEVGDCWVYRLVARTARGGSPERRLVVVVADVSAAQVVDSAGFDGEAPRETQHPGGPYLVTQGAAIFSPYMTVFRDTSPGGRIPGVKILDQGLCKPPYGCEVSARHAGLETVRVPAGTFEAIKVVVKHDWYPVSIQPGASSQNNELWGGRTLTVWYAPEAKRAVKFSSKLENGLSPPVESDFELELVSYHVK